MFNIPSHIGPIKRFCFLAHIVHSRKSQLAMVKGQVPELLQYYDAKQRVQYLTPRYQFPGNCCTVYRNLRRLQFVHTEFNFCNCQTGKSVTDLSLEIEHEFHFRPFNVHFCSFVALVMKFREFVDPYVAIIFVTVS